MTDQLVDPLPPVKPAEKHARLETDTFCVECGYNLHSQAVERDERLGIFVCRCPECGAFHPAGTGITAVSTWMSRLATGLLIVWAIFVLHAIAWICFALGALPILHIDSFSYSAMVAPDGREVEWGQAI